MAITPSQWSHVLTIPESYTPSAATSGQTLVITESVIAKLSAGDQTTFWSNVANGGGDVRICTDSGGVNQLPVEIVSLDNSAQTCVIWTRKPSYDGTGDLFVFIGKAGETQPAVTDPFGRNAVWTDYHSVLHLNDTSWVDSTGNGYDATGGASVTALGNPFGIGWADITSISDALTLPTGATLNNSFLTIQAILKIDADSGTDAGVVSNRWSTQGRDFFQITSSSSRSTFVTHDGGGENLCLGQDFSKSQPSWVAMTTDSGSVKSYIDGVLSGQDASIASDNQLATTLNTRVGTYFDASANRTLNGKVGEVRITLGTLPPSYIATEYANQNDPATFYGTPTIATTAGGGAVEQPVVSVTDFSLSLRQSVLSNTIISTALRAYKNNVTALSAALRQSAVNTTQLNASLREQVANTTTITTSLLATVLNGVAGVTSFNFALRSQTQNTITIETSLRELVSSNTELSTALRTGVISTHDIDTALRQGVQSVTPFAFNLIGGIVGITSLNTQLRESIDSTTNFTFQLFGEIDWSAPGKQALFTIQVTPANFTISTQKPEL